MKRNILRECLRIAREKLPRHPQYSFYPHFSFIVQDNKLVEWATNTAGTPPVHLGYEARIMDGSAKTHAEFNAWRRARGIIVADKPFECVNIRLNKRGEMRMSAPCSCCHSFLCELGCTSCYFTNDDGGWDGYSLTNRVKVATVAA
jgi:hypothetical protein